MMKKTYIEPAVRVAQIELSQIIANSLRVKSDYADPDGDMLVEEDKSELDIWSIW